MPSFSGLVADLHQVRAKFGQHTITFTYRPSAYNDEWSRELKAALKDDEATGVEISARGLAHVLVSWDITDDDGQTMPITEEVLGQLGLGVMNALDDAITGDLRPGNASKNGKR